MKCRSVVNEVVQEATVLFGKPWVVNEDYLNSLLEHCDIIDELMAEFDAIGFDVDVNPVEQTIEVEMICPLMIIQTKGEDHKLFQLMGKCNECWFSYVDDSNSGVHMIFPSVWTV